MASPTSLPLVPEHNAVGLKDPSRRFRLTRAFSLQWLLPVMLVSIVVAFYPAHYARRSTLAMYFHGVYHSRVLAMELVVAVGNVVDKLHLPLGILQRHSDGLLGGLVIVNVASFVLASALLYRVTVGSGVSRRFVSVYVLVIVLMAASGSVITPYDFTSYLMFVLVVFCAQRNGPRWFAVGVVAVIAAMCTRETAFVALATVAVIRLPLVRTNSGRTNSALSRIVAYVGSLRRDHVVVTLGAVGTLTYVTLHEIFKDNNKAQLFQHVHQSFNPATFTGIAVALLSFGGLRFALRDVSRDATYRVCRRVLWALSSPYVVVCLVYGLWNETPRLLMPLLLGEFLVAIATGTNNDNSQLLVDAREHVESLRT